MATVPKPVVYPESDGEPMAESEVHRDVMIDLILSLQGHFEGDDSVCVSGNMLMYYVEGNPRKSLAPDVFVALGVGKRQRRIYKVWEEGKGPDLVIEVTSKSTRREDLRGKFAIYRDVLRVREYVLFDPLDEYLSPSLQGYRLGGDGYEPIALADGRLPSVVVGLDFERDGHELRLLDPATGRRLPTPREDHEARRAAEAEVERLDEIRREQELENRRLREERRKMTAELSESEEARRRAEAEVALLREQLERLRGGSSTNGH